MTAWSETSAERIANFGDRNRAEANQRDERNVNRDVWKQVQELVCGPVPAQISGRVSDNVVTFQKRSA